MAERPVWARSRYPCSASSLRMGEGSSRVVGDSSTQTTRGRNLSQSVPCKTARSAPSQSTDRSDGNCGVAVTLMSARRTKGTVRICSIGSPPAARSDAVTGSSDDKYSDWKIVISTLPVSLPAAALITWSPGLARRSSAALRGLAQ